MSELQAVERMLCRATGRRHALLVGNGTIGLTLCLQALGLAGRRVLLPDSSCLNVPLAVLHAGAVPDYAEVRLADLGLDAARLDAPLRGAGALLAVHGYGSPCDLVALQARADAAGCPLIEDACLALGGQGPGGRPLGGFGLASVLSFGAGKPVSLDHGGAVLTDDDALAARLRALDAGLPAFSAGAQARIDTLGGEHTRLYNQHCLVGGDGEAGNGAAAAAAMAGFRRRAQAAGPDFGHRFDPARCAELAAALPGLAATVALRQQRLQQLHEALAPWLGGALQWLAPVPGAVPWRANLLVAAPPARDRLLRALHAAGLHASSWHPPASDFLADAPAAHPVAGRIGREVLNLWLDARCTPAYRDAVCRVLDEQLAATA
ncbi:MAG: DegT/DnrJ/EryC1/StrS family aminotransferase [Burkholderiaceae bacterium]|nr:DegT/DnrJ/EryC1/StrS family aminotransferase [Burkholderiaceae bacterium]